VILYHGNCFDGFGAALAAWLRFGDDAQYIACNYGDAPVVVPEGADVWMVDFSYPREIIEQMAARCRSLTIIDHHKTAEAELSALPYATFDINHSGATLAYEHFFPDDTMPRLFRYLEDRDLWRFSLPHSREVNGFIKSHPYEFPVWRDLITTIENDFYQCAEAGRVVLMYQQRIVEMVCAQARWQRIGDYNVPVCNSTSMWSEVGEHLKKLYPNALFVASYFDRADGQRIYSLRSGDDFDCSEVAKQFGGGGHHSAAGFNVRVGTAPLVRLS
jgi:oligoribonuclease NrnB/cAMP/cGMP phosphodiesterase (DHH superfamily)